MPGIEIGVLAISTFSLIVVGAALVGAAVAAFLAWRQGAPLDDLALPVDVLIAGGLLGILAARLLFVLFPPPSVAVLYDRAWYLAHPFDLQAGIIAVWAGGLSRAGALLGVLIAAYLLLRPRVDAWAWAERLGAGALVALAIMPWANVVNQQFLGPPTTLPWAVVGQHPTPAYASLWAMGVLVALVAVGSRLDTRRRRVLIGVGGYSLGLFALGFLRTNVARPAIGLTLLQLLALVLMAAAAVLIVYQNRNRSKAPLHSDANSGTVTDGTQQRGHGE